MYFRKFIRCDKASSCVSCMATDIQQFERNTEVPLFIVLTDLNGRINGALFQKEVTIM